MKTIVRIDRSSIKRNPNAGNTITFMPGLISVTFTFAGKPPKFMFKEPFVILETRNVNNEIVEVKGILNAMPKQVGYPGLVINVDRELRSIEHRPEPNYFYRYELTKVKCDECGFEINTVELPFYYDDDGYEYCTCPRCKEMNSFPEIEYEELTNEIIKAVK
jgi:phage FluMu protein Com